MKIVSKYNLILCPVTGHFNPVPTEGPNGLYSPIPLWEETCPGQWERHWGHIPGEGPISDMKLYYADLEKDLFFDEEEYAEWKAETQRETLGLCHPDEGGMECFTSLEEFLDYIPF